jgi:hypothetical protein
VQGHCHCGEQSASWGQGSWSRGACAAR